MKQLSREEMKKVMGGYNAPVDPGCTEHADCPDAEVICNGEPQTVGGRCVGGVGGSLLNC